MTAMELRILGRQVTVHRFDTVTGVLDAIITMIDQLPTLEERNEARKRLRQRLANVGECSTPSKALVPQPRRGEQVPAPLPAAHPRLQGASLPLRVLRRRPLAPHPLHARGNGRSA